MNNKRFRSILCLLLTVIMTGSLLNFALPVEAEAANESTQKLAPVTTHKQAVERIASYLSQCKDKFWAAKDKVGQRDLKKRYEELKQNADIGKYSANVLKDQACSASGKHVYPEVCKSNEFDISTRYGLSQCEGFVHYMSYVLFSEAGYLPAAEWDKKQAGATGNGWKKVNGDSLGDEGLKNFTVNTGDIIRYTTSAQHFVMVYQVNADGTFTIVQGNSPKRCQISTGNQLGGAIGLTNRNCTQANLRKLLDNDKAAYVIKSPLPDDDSILDTKRTYVELKLVKNANGSVKENPYAQSATKNSKTLTTLPQGTTGILATQLVQNAYGNWWYRVKVTVNGKEITGYMNANNVAFDKVPDDILTASYTANSLKTLKKESGCDLTGVISAKGVIITSATGAIRYRDGSQVGSKFTKTIEPMATSRNIKESEINKIKMGELPIGAYRYQVDATVEYWVAKNGDKAVEKKTHTKNMLISDDFTVGTVYTVTFNPNGGKFAAAGEIKNTDGKIFNTRGGKLDNNGKLITYYGNKTTLGSLPVPERDGYVLVGWYTTDNYGTGVNRNTTVSGNITYYAGWGYEIKYDANGGSGAPDAQKKKIGQSLTLSETVPTREGYTFEHWCANPDSFLHGYQIYQPGSQYSKDGNVTLYAHWKPTSEICKVTFNAHGGSETEPREIIRGRAIGELPKPTRSGYAFQGWYTAESGGNKISSQTIVNGNVTFHAQWKKMYTVTFDANGGSGGPRAQTKWHGEDLTLSTSVPTRSGYTFDHWCTAPNAFFAAHWFVKEYQPGEQYTKDENITLYAHWEKSTETTISAERPDLGSNKPTAEGEQPAVTQPPTNGDNKAQQADYLTSCTRYPSYGRVSVKTADYLYSLPCDSSTDSRSVKGTKQSAGAWLSVDGLYKNSKGQYWYSVELPSGAGYISAASTTSYQCMPLLKDVTIENAALPKNHIQGKSYSIGGTIRAGHLYLNEVAGSIQDSYNHSSTKTLSYSNDQQCTSLNLKSSAINTALKFGSLKAGNCLYVITVSADYYYSADGKTLSFWRQTEDLIWHEFKVVAQGKDVRFLSEGKEIYSTTVTETDNYLTMQSKPYDKPGHTFKGWYAYRDSDGTWYTNKGWQTQSSIDKNKYTKKIYSAGSKYNLYHSSWGDSDFTFYAVWEYTGSGKDARFVSDGTVISSFHATPGNNMLTIAAAPAGKPGYTFRGWNVQRDADGTWYVDGRGWNTEASITANKYTKKLYAPGTKVDLYDSTWVDEASVTFYALWKAPDTYAVTYDANGGTGAPEGQQKIAGVDLTLSDTIPSRTGCQFLGWAADSGATAPEYQPGAVYTADAAVTLYAVWQVQTGLQVPDVTGMYVREAQLLLRMSGFVPQYDFTEWDDYRYVTAQTPTAGAFETAGGTVTLTTTSTAPASIPRLMDRYPIDDASVRSWEEQGRCILGVNNENTLFKFETGSDWWPATPYTTEKLCQVELSFTGDLPKNAYTICILTEGGNYYELPFGTDYFGNPGTVLAYMNKGSFNLVVMELDVPTGEWYHEYSHVQLTVTGSGRYNLTIQPDEQPDEGILVPDVTGMYVREAQLLLRLSGFVPQYDFTEWDDYRYVTAQTPTAGAFETAGGTVTLTTTSTAPASIPRLMDRYPIDDASVRSWEEQGRCILGVNDKKALYKFETGSDWRGWTTPYTTEKLCQVELSFTGDLTKNTYISILTEGASFLLPFGTDYFGNPGTVLVYMNKGSFNLVASEWNETGETFEDWGRAELTVTGSGRYELTIQPTEKPVPDVTGMRFDEACTLLKEEGFAVDETAYSADTVVDGQTPAAGTLVEPGSTVTLSCGNAGRSATSAYRYAVIDPETGAGLAWLDDDHLQPDTVEKDALSQTLNEVKLHITGSGYQGYPMKITPGGHLSPEYGQELAPDGNGDISIGAAPQSYTLWIEAAEGKFLCFPFTVSGDGTIDIDLTRKINVSYYNEDGSLYRTDEIDTSSVSAEISVGSYDQVKDGYTFAGWSVNGGTPNLPSSSVFTAFDISFTAVWTENAPDEEPVGENDAPKMYGAPEPVADPEPSTALEPTPDPEPSTAPEPTPDPEPSTAPEPSPNLEPAAEASE